MIRKAENNNVTNNLSEKTNLEAPQFFPINTVQIGSCLFWSTALAYLVDLKQDKQTLNEEENDLKFHLACIALFGQISAADEKRLKKLVDQFHVTHDLTFIYRNGFVQDLIFLFRQRVVDYIDQHSDLFKSAITDFARYLASMRLATKFAGKYEIKAMTALLNCSIEVVDIDTDLTVVYSLHDNKENFCKNESLIQLRRLRLFMKPEKQYYYFGLKQIKKTEQSDFFTNKQLLQRDIEINNQSLLISIDVPRDGSCLFWAAALAYLISMREEHFEEACRTLFGSCFSTDLEDIKEEITNFNLQSVQNLQDNRIFVDLVRRNFRRQVVNYMCLHRNEFELETNDIDNYFGQMLLPNTWGGWQEVKAISRVLGREILLLPSWGQSMEDPLRTGSGVPVLYLFYDENHYSFAVLKTNIKNYSVQNFNDLYNEKIEDALGLSDYNVAKKSTKIKNPKLNTIAELKDDTSVVLKPNLFNDLIEGVSIGLFAELSLRLLTSIPLIKFLACEKIDIPKNIRFSALVDSPYLYSQNYKEFLLRSMEFDTFLNNFLAKDRLFTDGILLGMVVGLIKNIFNSENRTEFFLVMSIFFSILPLDHFFDKNIERIQLLFRCLLMVVFSINGLASTVDFSLTGVKKVANGVSASVEKISTKLPVSFFAPKPEKKVTDSEPSLRYGK